VVGADRPEFNAPAFGQRYFHCLQSWIDSGMYDLEIDKWQIGIDMSAKTTTEIRDAIRSAFRGKPVKQVDVFGSAARGEIAPDSDVDLLVTPSSEATRHDLFIMAAEVEDALGRRIDFLIRSDVEAMKDVEARNLILKNAVTVYVP
jgi:predicted nucleotidyltransferase